MTLIYVLSLKMSSASGGLRNIIISPTAFVPRPHRGFASGPHGWCP